MKHISNTAVDKKIDELIHAEAERRGIDFYKEVDEILKQFVEDKELLDKLQSARNLEVCRALEIAFYVGWLCAKSPEVLIFENIE